MQASDASRLAGVTPHQLKEWCTRRGIVVPDVPGAGRGRHALFSWQTVLTLRMLRELHIRFGVEMSAWKGALGQFREQVDGCFFPSLLDVWAAFVDRDQARLLDGPSHLAEAAVMVPLAPHLRAIAHGFEFSPEPQLPLFAAVGLRR